MVAYSHIHVISESTMAPQMRTSDFDGERRKQSISKIKQSTSELED